METVCLNHPFTTYWCNRFVWEPLFEGALRITRVFEPSRSFFEKSWDLLTGSALLTPLVGAVIWLFWKTFGDPKLLHTQPHACPPAPPPSPISRTASSDGVAASCRVFEYDDARWTLYPEQQETIRYECRYKTGAKEIFSWYKEGLLQRMIYQEGDLRIEMELKESQIYIRENQISKIYSIPPNTRWIQQPSVGLSSFAKESAEKLTFFVINTEPTVSYLLTTIEHLQLLEMEATKQDGKITYLRKGISPRLFQGHLEFDSEGMMKTLCITGLAGTLKNLNSNRI